MPLVGTIGAVSTGAAGAAVTPAYGTGETRAVNNLLILQVLVTGSATLPATPSGWSVAKQQAGTSCSASIFEKVAAGADAAPTIAAVTSGTINAQLAEYSGLVPANPVNKTGGVAGTTSPIVATATAADLQAGGLVVACGGAVNSSARANTMAHSINNGVGAGTATTNGATSTVSHYDFAYGFTTSGAAADSDSFSFGSPQLTGAVVAIASFRVPVAAVVTATDAVTLGSSIASKVSQTRTTADSVPIGKLVNYDTIVLADSPAVYYQLNEAAGSPMDSTGATTATLVGSVSQGGPALLSGSGGSYGFAASPDSYVAATGPTLPGAWSLEAWARADADRIGAFRIFGDLSSWFTYGLAVMGAPSAPYFFLHCQATNVYAYPAASFTIAPGVAYHYVAAYDGAGQVTVYVNGVAVATSAAPAPVAGRTEQAGIGGMFGQPAASAISKAAIYSHALTPAQAQAHYTAGLTPYDAAVLANAPAGYWPLNETTGTGAVDLSGNGHPGTYTGGFTLGQAGIGDGGSAPLFDGVSGMVAIGDAPTLRLVQPFSIEAWVNPTDFANYWIAVSKATSGSAVAFSIYTVVGNGQFVLYEMNTGYGVGVPPAVGAFTHIAWTDDGTTVRFYINTTQPWGPGASTAMSATTDPLQIGNRPDGFFWKGNIAKVALYSHALSAAQVASHFGTAAVPASQTSGADVATGTKATSITATASDAITVADSATRAPTTLAARSATNPAVTVSDSAARAVYGRTRSSSDASAVSDAATRTLGFTRTAADPWGASSGGAAPTATASFVAEHTTPNTIYTAPSGIASGDWLVIYQFLYKVSVGYAFTVTPPAGFVAAPGTWPQLVVNLGGNQNIAEYMWIKQAGSSEPSTYTVTHAALDAARGLIFRVSGADPTTPMTPALTQNIASNNATTTTFLGLTTTVANELIVICSADDNDNGASLTPPTGTTPTFTALVNDRGGNFMASGPLATAGATGNKTMTNNSASSTNAFGFVASMLAFQPASGAGIADSATAAKGATGTSRTATDSWTLGDVAGRAAYGRARSSADAVGAISDTAAGVKVIIRSASDSWAVSDSATRTARTIRAAGDAVSVSDAAARAAYARARTSADAVAVSDTAAGVKVIIRSAADALSVADVASRAARAMARQVSDSLTVGDAATRQLSATRDAGDSWSVSDHSARSAMGQARLCLDLVTVTDTSSARLLRVSAFDSFTVSDLAVGIFHALGGSLHVDVVENVAGLAWTWSVARLDVAELEAAATITETVAGVDIAESTAGVIIIEED